MIGLCKNRIKKMSKKGPVIEANGLLCETPKRKPGSLASFCSYLCARERNAGFEGKKEEINIY